MAFSGTSWRNKIAPILSSKRSIAVSYVDLSGSSLSLPNIVFDVAYLQTGDDRSLLSANLSAIKLKYPKARLVLVLRNFGISDLAYGHKMGISAILHENAAKDQIQNSLNAAVRGDLYISSAIVDKSQNADPENLRADQLISVRSKSMDLLSHRELQVLRLVARGMANRAIAKTLFISEKTVKNHLYNIFKKIGVTDRTKAALFAVKALTLPHNETFGPVSVSIQSDN